MNDDTLETVQCSGDRFKKSEYFVRVNLDKVTDEMSYHYPSFPLLV